MSLEKAVYSLKQDVGRNKSARRQQGRMFPAIGAPETPILRLTLGQAYLCPVGYSGLRRDMYNDERATKECSAGLAAVIVGAGDARDKGAKT